VQWFVIVSYDKVNGLSGLHSFNGNEF